MVWHFRKCKAPPLLLWQETQLKLSAWKGMGRVRSPFRLLLMYREGMYYGLHYFFKISSLIRFGKLQFKTGVVVLVARRHWCMTAWIANNHRKKAVSYDSVTIPPQHTYCWTGIYSSVHKYKREHWDCRGGPSAHDYVFDSLIPWIGGKAKEWDASHQKTRPRKPQKIPFSTQASTLVEEKPCFEAHIWTLSPCFLRPLPYGKCAWDPILVQSKLGELEGHEDLRCLWCSMEEKRKASMKR